MMAMMDNPGTFTDANGTWTGGGELRRHEAQQSRSHEYDLLPTADDPHYMFNVTAGQQPGSEYPWLGIRRPVLLRRDGLRRPGELHHRRGDVGFDVTGDPSTNQFALPGLSDSANLVLMYENFGFTVRLAYNWRDEFLQNVNRAVPEIRSTWKSTSRST